MSEPKIDPIRLNKYDKLLMAVWESADALVDLYKTMSPQEKILAGGVVLQAASPWKENNISAMAGEEETIIALLNRAVRERRSPSPTPPMDSPPIFGDTEKDDDLPN